MTRITVAMVVEGQGEVAALPVLLRRVAAELVPTASLDLPRPYRKGRGELIKAGGIELAVEQAGHAAGILVLVDADDDCPALLGPQLLERARQARPDRRISVVLANREFEAWFLAAAPSLSGVRGLKSSLALPEEPESPRDCKGWITTHRVDGQSYRPTADQAALAATFDLAMARAHSSSFEKFYRDAAYLCTGQPL